MATPRRKAIRLPLELVLSGWVFLRTDRGDVHLAGYAEMEHEGWVSSPLIAFDRGLKAAESTSGRTYLLVGGPGLGLDAQRSLNRWLAAKALAAWDDVTELVATHGLGAALRENGCCEA